MKLFFVFLIASFLGAHSLSAEPIFNDIPPSPQVIPLKESLGLRLGLVSSGLFSSQQGRPFFYFDTGLRYKSDHAYFDLRLPAFIATLDYLFFIFQEELLESRNPFNFFQAINSPLQYGAYVEGIMLRVGQTFTLHPFEDKSPLRLTAGAVFLGEFVFFDLALFDDRDLEEFEPREDPNAADPFIAAPGGFLAIGMDFPGGAYDIAIGGGPDVFLDSAYSANSGAVVFIDSDIQIDVSEDIGVSLRARLSTYTHTESLVFTLVVGGGVMIRLY